MPRRRPSARVLSSVVAAAALSAGAVAATSSVPAAAVTGITGPDVSSYQHPHGASINWAAVKRENRAFAIVKATESSWYVNPWFGRDYSGAYKAGLVRGSYHFAQPAYPIVSTAKAQAEFYLSRLGSTVLTARTLPPALDLEVTGGLSRAALVEWAQTFLLTVRKESGRTPMIYTYPWFWWRTIGDAAALSRYPLWFASYDGALIPRSTTLWQFTAGGKVAGIRGGVDLSRLYASPDQWSTLSDGTVATPWDPAAPGAPIGVHAAAGSHSATVTWLPGDAGTSGITGYHAVASPGGASVDVGALTTQATVPGLDNGTSYTFTVTASNAVGVGAPSAASNPVMPAAATSLVVSSPATATIGTQVPVSAVLTDAESGSPIAGAPVTVDVRAAGHGAWSTVATLTTNDSGAVATSVSVPFPLEVRASYAGAPGLQPATTVRAVLVRTTVSAALSRTVVHPGRLVTLRGWLSPASGGVTVIREGWYDHAWHVWAVSHTGPRGGYVFQIHPTVRTTDVYRIVARAGNGATLGVSPVRRLHVR